jgi:hypothetical protein
MGSADSHDVNGNRPGNRESGVPVPRDVICGDCGDDPYLDYSGVPARFQRLRGPYPLREGAAAYQQHLAEDYLTMGAR